MNKNLIENEDFQTVTPFENGLFTITTLNTESESNSGLLEDFQNVDTIPQLPFSTNSCFDGNDLPKIETLDSLLSHLCELMIRFDGCVKDYQKSDFEHLVKTVTNSLIYLYSNNPQPIVDYMVVEVFTDLNSIPNQFVGMHVFVKSENANYTKKTSGWTKELTLPIDSISGSTSKFLNERGEMVELNIEPIAISNVISKTYVELYSMVSNKLLLVGQKYVISDYNTTHIIPNTSVLNDCQIEPLIVTAVAIDKLANVCYSTLFPQDIVFYEIENKQNILLGCSKGYIYRRIDTVRNNDIGMDWRNIKYRRWIINVSNTWSPDFIYDLDAVVNYNNLIYVCISTNGNWNDINNNFESTGIYNGEYISLNESGLNIYVNNKLITIPAGQQYKDITMFNDANNIN